MATGTRIADLAALSEALARTRSRLDRMRLLGEFLRDLPAAERPAAARFLVGRALPAGDARRLDVSASTLWQVVSRLASGGASSSLVWGEAVDFGDAVARLFEAASRASVEPAMTVPEMAAAMNALADQAGKGARRGREEVLTRLLGKASPSEARFLVKVVLGDMRHGANEGVLLEAVARATGSPPAVVRQTAMFLGDVGDVVRLAFEGGPDALAGLAPTLFSPVKPMLAQTAPALDAAWGAAPARVAVEYKLDGARVQIHAQGETVRLFSRRLHDVTGSLPDVVAEVRQAVAGKRLIAEGEVIAVDPSGRPRPFQQLLQRYRRVREVEDVLRDVPLRLFLFDLLLEEGEPLFGRPYAERWERLAAVCRGLRLVPRLLPSTLEEARAFYRQAVADGHEGIMLKRLDGAYTPGTRGGSWLKLKRVTTLDLVIVAADYGYGRRHGWLSNYHLAARDEETGEYRPVGKTFKGLTDAQFRDMTARLLSLKRGQEGGTVLVQPAVVVEVAYSDLQQSGLYPDGMALRFARITAIREDKAPAQADTIQTLRRLFAAQWA